MKQILPFLILFFSIFLFSCNDENITKEYNVEFLVGEEVYHTLKIQEGKKINCPTDPIKDGYHFVCWELNGEEFDFESPITSDISLKAKWEKEAKYLVKFYVDKKVYLECEVLAGELVLKPENPIKSKYDFVCWELNGEEYDFESPVTSDISLTAKWEPIIFDIFDIFLYDGAKEVDVICIDEGDTLKDLKYIRMSKEFYTFLGWFDEDGNKVDETYIPTSSMNLYAKWEALGTIYEVYLDDVKKEILEGTVYTLPTKSKAGYDLVGWVDEDSYFIENNVVVNRNMKLTSVWATAGKQGTSYKLNLDTVKEVNVLYKDTYRLPAILELGYEHVCWTDGTYFYNIGYEVLMVGNLDLTPVLNELDMGENYSYLSYTISNLDYLYENTHFPLTNDIKLPSVDPTTGATISWKSSDESVISDSGEITRIMTREHKTSATLTATVTYNGESITKDYNYTVKRSLKDISKGVVGGYFRIGGGLNEAALNTLDIVYGAFIYFSADGRLTTGSEYVRSINLILGDAHEHGIRVVVSVGAQSSGSGGPIATIAKQAHLREKFAKELLNFVVANNLDGVDMDWERPSSDNVKNYTELMKVIYNTFKDYDEELLVTSAIGAGPWQYSSFDLRNSGKYHDYINMMSYDMQNSSVSSYHNALYATKNTRYLLNSQCTIDATVALYNSVGIPNEKIIIGIPFYGKKFINSEGVGKAGTYSSSTTQAAIRLMIYNSDGIKKENVEFWDDDCKVPYIYDSENKVFVTYDNPRSIMEKMKYAGEKGIAGVMYWAHDHDNNNLLMNALNENLSYLKDR